jgi:hypothetical protein
MENHAKQSKKHLSETRIEPEIPSRNVFAHLRKKFCSSYYLYSGLEIAVTNLIFGVGISLQT